jgi:hypothetical protein
VIPQRNDPGQPRTPFRHPGDIPLGSDEDVGGGADAQEVQAAGDLIVRAKQRPQAAAHVPLDVDLNRVLQRDARSDGRGEVAAHRLG